MEPSGEVSAPIDPATKWQPVAGADLKLHCPYLYSGGSVLGFTSAIGERSSHPDVRPHIWM